MDLFQEEQDARDESAQATAENQQAEDQTKSDWNQQQAKTAIYSSIANVNTEASKWTQAKGLLDETIGRIKHSVSTYPGLDTSNPALLVGQLLLVVCGVSGAYALDYFLFSSFTGFILEMTGSSASFLVAARFIVPAIIVSLELALATLIDYHRRKANVFAVVAFTVLAGATLVALSSMTTATLLAGQGITSFGEMSLIEKLLMIPMMLFSALPHAILLFSGRIGGEGKAVVFVLLRRRKARKINKEVLQYANMALFE